MLDSRALARINRESTQRAARERRVPVIITPEDIDAYQAGDERALSIPYIGQRLPRGYRRLGDPVFVDKSGSGSESEPAWTLRRFLEHVRECGESYWGAVEEGEFQIYVQRYARLWGNDARD